MLCNRLYMKDQDTCIGKCPEKQLRQELYHILIYMFLFLQREADQESGGSSHLLFYLQLQAFVQLVTCSTSIVSGYVFLHVCFSLQTFTFIIMSISNDSYLLCQNQCAVLYGFRDHDYYVAVHALGQPKHKRSNDW